MSNADPNAEPNDMAALRAENHALRDELAALNREFDGFAYSVSHDLRAPLRTIDGFAQILEEDYVERLDDEGRRVLRIVREGSQRMSRLIDDLLTLSRLSRQPLKIGAVDLDSLVADVTARIKPGDRRVEFAVEPLGSTQADESLAQRIFENLVDNAVKFTRQQPHARIEIGIHRARHVGEVDVYRVTDNGAGFDSRYASKLFGVFQRLHGANEFEGSGVGLAMVQRAVVRHGGRVWGESVVGEGATFFFTLQPGEPARTPSRTDS